MSNWMQRLVWLPAGDPRNPYPFEVLDCRNACLALSESAGVETAPDAVAAIQKTVEALPPTPLMADGSSVGCAITIRCRDGLAEHSKSEALPIGHKWLLDRTDQTILARRRWTGQLIHIAEFEMLDEWLTINRLTYRAPSVYGSWEYAVAEIEFLLKTYVEGAPSAFPIPPGLSRDNTQKIALEGWKVHGPIAQFGRLLQ